MRGYYSDKLAGEKLRQVYDLAPPRVRQYLNVEIEIVLSHIKPTDVVLELGCGYGRVLEPMAQKAALAVGIDTSRDSLSLLQKYGGQETGPRRCRGVEGDAAALPFKDGVFDLTACIQNGISAFHVDQRRLISEAVRVTRRGGTVLFSSYSDKFWHDRLEWFELQAAHGLLGEIDYSATGNGVIVCKDGFTATTVSPDQFSDLTSGLDVECGLIEVDHSSLFCIMTII